MGGEHGEGVTECARHQTKPGQPLTNPARTVTRQTDARQDQSGHGGRPQGEGEHVKAVGAGHPRQGIAQSEQSAGAHDQRQCECLQDALLV